jgi:hypothetical protein
MPPDTKRGSAEFIDGLRPIADRERSEKQLEGLPPGRVFAARRLAVKSSKSCALM